MDSETGSRHPNYVILNLVGYGLAKFESELTALLGFRSKAEFFRELILRKLARTRGTLKNRQDLFNPLVRGGKTGWWQNGDRYLHRKTLLDSFVGELDAISYAAMLTKYLRSEFPLPGEAKQLLPPIMKSQFQRLQETGAEAELFFMLNYRQIEQFADSSIADGRQLGDGYDFQLTSGEMYWLVEVKGLRASAGGIRLTEKEFGKAEEFRSRFCLIVVTNLDKRPVISPVFNPLERLNFTRRKTVVEQLTSGEVASCGVS